MNFKLTGQFDPFGLAEIRISGRHLHLLIRITVIVIAIIFLIRRISQYHKYLFKPLCLIETLIFLDILISYATRSEPVDRSTGIKEILIPLIGAITPFALLLTPPTA
jgi:hypothetical protein